MDAIELVKKAQGPAIATDRQNRITACNEAARELFGFTEEGAPEIGQNLFDFFDAKDTFGNRVASEQIAFWEMINRGESLSPFELDMRTASGESERMGISVVVVVGPEPSAYDLVYLLRPVFRRRRADEAIERILFDPEFSWPTPARRSTSGKSAKSPNLTPRQLEVLKLLAQGNSVEEIAKSLDLSVHTVRSHFQSLFMKLEVHSQLEAVAVAYRDRLI